MNPGKPRSWTPTLACRKKSRQHFNSNCTQTWLHSLAAHRSTGLHTPPCSLSSLGILEEKEWRLPGSVHTKTLKSGNSAWSGCRRSTRKQIVPERPSNRLQKLVGEREPLLNSSVKRNSANLQERNKRVYFTASLTASFSLLIYSYLR